MTHLNQGRFAHQVESLRRQFLQTPGLPFGDVLTDADVAHVLEAEQVEGRERVFTPLLTVRLLLTQAVDPDPSCRQALSRLLAERASEDLPPISAQTGAYCQARQRLPEGVLEHLTSQVGERLLEQAPVPWLFQGRAVKVVDGTTLSMPDTPANQAAYPQPRTQQPGLGFPLLRLVVVFALATGGVLAAALTRYRGKQTSELALFRSLHDTLFPGDVVLADRFFCSYFEIALLQQRGVDVVVRLHQRRRADFRRGRRLGPHDHCVTWSKPACPDWMDAATYEQMPDTLTLREVRIEVPQPGFRTRHLVVVTTLLDPHDVAPTDLAELFRTRWQAELHLRSLKTTLGMDVLRAKTPAMVRKELWAHLLAYNLIRTVMAQAADQHHVQPTQLSFTGTLQTLRAFAPYALTATAAAAADLAQRILAAIATHRVGDRPDRCEPRAVKRRPKPYPLLTRPRAEARARLLTSGCD